MGQLTRTSAADGVATLAIANPPMNVLSRAVFQEIAAAFDSFRADQAVRAVVLTGEGAHFAAGADVKEFVGVTDPAVGEANALEAHHLASAIEEGDLPVIAAIHGYCLGGGCELALACHLRIAADTARIGQPEIKIGIMPGMGGTVRLPRLVGPAKALELLWTGEPVSAAEAHRIGLVNAVVPEADLKRQAAGLARRIAAMSRLSVVRILRSVREGWARPTAEASRLEAKLFGELMGTSDKREGVAAFLEKRPPRFTDR